MFQKQVRLHEFDKIDVFLIFPWEEICVKFIMLEKSVVILQKYI